MKKIDYFIQDWRLSKVRPYIKHGDTVMDIGAHKGELFKRYSDKIKYGIGIEPLVSETITDSNFKIYPGFFPEGIPESEQTVDVITMLAVLEHIPVVNQKAVSEGCARWLKKGGLLIITVPSPAVDIILDILVFLKISEGMSLEEHYGFKTSETVNIFKQPLFKLLKKSKFQFGLNNLFVFERL